MTKYMAFESVKFKCGFKNRGRECDPDFTSGIHESLIIAAKFKDRDNHRKDEIARKD